MPKKFMLDLYDSKTFMFVESIEVSANSVPEAFADASKYIKQKDTSTGSGFAYYIGAIHYDP
jgi:hypothetical protein